MRAGSLVRMTRRQRTIVIAVALVLVVALGMALWWPRSEPVALPMESPTPSVTTSPSPSSTPSALPTPSPSPVPSPSPSSSPSPSPSPTRLADQECATPEESFAPTHFTIERLGAHERVIARPLQGGQVPAPPLNDRRSAAWWNGSPQAGAERGKSVLTIHTYRPSLRPALGNELYAGGTSTLRSGDIIKLHGADGAIACYEFTEAPRIHVDDYDPASTVMLDPTGDPSLVIVICWDFNQRTSHWDSRVMFQFDLV